jgi:hypothetical protein
MSSTTSSHNSRNDKQQQQNKYHNDENRERKFKQIESVDEEAKINRQLRLHSNQQQKYSLDVQQYRHLRQHSSLVKARKPIIIENVRIKHKLKRHSSARSPRTSSSSFHSTSRSPEPKNKQHAALPTTTTPTSKYQELKNRLFILEIELDNERKTVFHEKEIKLKAISELKTRFEIEKKAALRALEAKLNAEKLEEFNKYKENAEIEKSNEIDYLIKANETELINFKMKLREKSEKLVINTLNKTFFLNLFIYRCSKFEQVIKEERVKFNQSHQKSFEVIEKYSNELKLFKAKKMYANENIKIKVNYDDRATQTNVDATPSDYYQQLFDKLKKLHSNLVETTSHHDDLKLVENIEDYIKKFNKRFDEVDNERQKLVESLEEMKKDYKQLKDSKTKLEVLYKIKCKSDLDKSSVIKKLRLDYEMELMKFRTEENSNLVHHLEKQLSLKELQVMEQSYELETWRSHETTFNSVGLYGGVGVNSITNSFNQDITNSHNTFFNSSLNSTNKIITRKKVPVDILYTSDPDVVTSTVD